MRSLRVATVTVVFAALALLALSGNVQAQHSPTPDWNNLSDPLKAGVGLHYGRVAGHGLSFRMPLRWYVYLQPTGGIWHSSDRKQHDLGVALHYVLRQDQRLRFFLGGGLAYFYDNEMSERVNGREVWVKDTDWNYGAGVGIERLVGPRWSVKVEADFIHYGDSGDTKVTPQVGVYYYW
ncbi:MAG: porin family protein [bacterium]|nr:porin family protein [bacterium]